MRQKSLIPVVEDVSEVIILSELWRKTGEVVLDCPNLRLKPVPAVPTVPALRFGQVGISPFHWFRTSS